MATEWERLQGFINELRGPSAFGLDDSLTRDMDLYHNFVPLHSLARFDESFTLMDAVELRNMSQSRAVSA